MGALDGERLEVVVRLEKLGDAPRMERLVKAGLLEADAERLQVPRGHMARRKGGDGGGVDAPAEEDADGDIGDEPAPHGRVEQRAKLLAPGLLGIGGNLGPREGLQDKIPVFRHPGRECPLVHVERERMAAGKLVDVFKYGVRRRNVAVPEVFLERPARKRAVDARVGSQGGELRAEDKGAVLGGIEKGLLAEPVPAAEQPAPGEVIDDKGPHPVAVRGKLLAPLAISAKENLGVGVVGAKLMPPADQLGAELRKIVDLAVKDDDKAAIGVKHRLMAARKIENREAAVAEEDGAGGVHPVARVVRAPVREGIGHAPEIGLGSRAHKARDAAHGQAANGIGRAVGPAFRAVRRSAGLSRFALPLIAGGGFHSNG